MKYKEILAECGQLRTTYTKSGLRRFEADVYHKGLDKFTRVRGDDPYVVNQKAKTTMSRWDAQWKRQCDAEEKRRRAEEKRRRISEEKHRHEMNKEAAEEQTRDAQSALEEMSAILEHTLSIDDTIDWDSLKTNAPYDVSKPRPPARPDMPALELPRKPEPTDLRYQPDIGFFDSIFSSRKTRKIDAANQLFNNDLNLWQSQVNELEAEHRKRVEDLQHAFQHRLEAYHQNLAEWRNAKSEFEKEQESANRAIDEHRERYLAAEHRAVIEYCEFVLANSQYPDSFPQEFEIEYRPEPKIMIVEYQLPDISDLPNTKEVKYIKSRREFSEKQISQAQLNKLYDSVIYQIALRTIHELFEADAASAIDAIVFNGVVESIDAATGHEIRPCILSLQTSKAEFEAIALGRVEPKACFKKLKGVAGARLHSLAPVPPIIQLDRDDDRFVSSYAVIDTLDEGENLAAMDWEDFEHLIRELFEREFAEHGGEVKVTQASRDGGIDAVIFDPDPLRGGKIVIQAKRYTNTVPVASARELYGTLQDEGANKGILVTTSDFGKDAYEFVRGKPLQLINGGQLLHLLHRHGHKARIDLKEAKAALRSQ